MSENSAFSNEHHSAVEAAADAAPWFAAMEYHALILNRTYKVFVTDQMLCGAKVRGLVASPPVVPREMYDQEFWIGTKAARIYDGFDATSAKFLELNSANFQFRWIEIIGIEYLSSKKWGMGNVPYSGRLILQLQAGRARELILLGRQNGAALKRTLDHLRETRS